MDARSMAKRWIDGYVKSHPVVIFSKTYCPYCVKVKKLLTDEIKIPASRMAVYELENRPDMAEMQEYLKELTGASSVPRVFINGECYGGCDDLFFLHKSGQLKRLLEGIVEQ